MKLLHDLHLHVHPYLYPCLCTCFDIPLQPTLDIQINFRFWCTFFGVFWSGCNFNIHPLAPYFFCYTLFENHKIHQNSYFAVNLLHDLHLYLHNYMSTLLGINFQMSFHAWSRMWIYYYPEILFFETISSQHKIQFMIVCHTLSQS